MADYPLHRIDAAPAASQPLMQQAEAAYGFVPNLIAVMAESPVMTEAYMALNAIFAGSSLTPEEQQVVLLTVSRANGCDYCQSAHGAICSMQCIDPALVRAILADESIADPRLQALRGLTLALIEKRGWLEDSDIEAFVGAGYDKSQVFDVIVGLGMKTLSNYVNHIAGTPVDEAFTGAAGAQSAL